MNSLVYAPLESLPVSLNLLEQEASRDGFSMMTRLRLEWDTGVNRFKGDGEILLGALRGDDLVGTAGLSHDPCLDDPTVGRVRHVYVLERERGAGVASALVRQIILRARRVLQEPEAVHGARRAVLRQARVRPRRRRPRHPCSGAGVKALATAGL